MQLCGLPLKYSSKFEGYIAFLVISGNYYLHKNGTAIIAYIFGNYKNLHETLEGLLRKTSHTLIFKYQLIWKVKICFDINIQIVIWYQH